MNDQSINQDDLSKYVQDLDDIKQCLKNILFTVPGTFPLLPEFGSDLYKYIDKPVTESFGKLRNVIIAALEKYEPRVKITKVTRTIEGERIWINIFGTLINTGETVISEIIINGTDPVHIASINLGALYNWYAVTDGRSIANEGWKVPSVADVNTFLLYVDPSAAPYDIEESIIPVWGNEVGNILSLAGSNLFGFGIKNSGQRKSDGSFDGKDTTFNMWTSDSIDGFQNYTDPPYDWAWYLQTYFPGGGNSGGVSVGDIRAICGLSLRLVRLATTEETSLDDGAESTPYIGNDLKVYRTIKIGSQIWLKDHLCETQYSDGSYIPFVTENSEWSNLALSSVLGFSQDSVILSAQVDTDEEVIIFQGFAGIGKNISKLSLHKSQIIGDPDFDIRVSIYHVVDSIPTTKISDSTNTYKASELPEIPMFYFPNIILPVGDYCFMISYENVILHNELNHVEFYFSTGSEYAGGYLGSKVNDIYNTYETSDLNAIIYYTSGAMCYYDNDINNAIIIT